jgi:hypothetical protein
MSVSLDVVACNKSSYSKKPPLLIEGLLQEKIISQSEKTIFPISSLVLKAHYERRSQLNNLRVERVEEFFCCDLVFSKTPPLRGLLRKMFANLWNMYQFANETRKYAENVYTDEEFEEIEESFCLEEEDLSEREILLGAQFILESVEKPLDSDDIADILSVSPLSVQKTLLKFKNRKK